jgi:hypothetical protein
MGGEHYTFAAARGHPEVKFDDTRRLGINVALILFLKSSMNSSKIQSH